MVSRDERGVHLDAFDELELEELEQPIPGSPMHPDEAVLYAVELRDRAIAIGDTALQSIDSSNAQAQQNYWNAINKATRLGIFRSRILDLCRDEEIAYELSRAAGEATPRQ